MEEIKTSISWRGLLKAACETQQKRQRLAEQIGVTERTILRWTKGEGSPQKSETIRRLSQAIPEMPEALHEAFPDAFVSLPANEQIKIPFELLWPVIDAFAHVPHSARRWTIFHLVASQLLLQLDSEGAGMLVIYVSHAQQDSEEFIRLEESAGTHMWATRQMTAKSCTDSWLVQEVRASRPFFIQSCEQSMPPSCIVRHDLVKSIGFFPIYCGGIAIGGIFLCSAIEDGFSPIRQALIKKYSCLLSLAFSPFPQNTVFEAE